MFDANTGFICNWDNILKTTNGGENWHIFYTGFSSNNSSISMVDPNTGYILLDSTKLIKTTNGGSNWYFVSNIEHIKLRLSYFQYLNFISSNTGFILSREGDYYWRGSRLMRTSNAGMNWNTLIADTSFTLYEIDFPTSTIGYAGGSKHIWTGSFEHFKIFKTINGGTSWDSIQNTLNMDVRCIEFIDGNTGFAGGQYSNIGGRIIKTTNGGLNWILNEYNFQGVQDIYFVNQDVGYVLGGNSWFYKTTNGGNNWTSVNIYSVNGQNYLYNLYFSDMDTGLGVGTGGLIVKTTNGGINWIKKSHGTDNWLWDVRFSDINTGFAAGDYGTLLKTTNGGVNWELSQFYWEDDLSAIANIDSYKWFIASGPDGKIFKTTNTGLSWDTLYTNLYAINRLEFINQNTGFGVCKYNTFFKTTNGGMNWIIYNNLNYSQNWSMDFIDENTGYAGYKTAKTTNGGINWDTISLGFDFVAYDIQFLNHNTGFLAGGYNNYGNYHGLVLKTTNGGFNWTSVEIAAVIIEDIYFVNQDVGFVMHGNLIFKTTNGGLNWFQLRTCSNNYYTVSYFNNASTGYLVGSVGNIIKTTNGGGEPIGIQPISNEVPYQFILHQNYPNPFNPVTKIQFSIPPSKGVRGMSTRLVIYDILGREIATLVNEQLSPGVYEVEWNGTNYSSGIYFYQISINNEQLATKKMVLIK
jgi:photosystem II stability/assembly factor-like uncharacterized protein